MPHSHASGGLLTLIGTLFVLTALAQPLAPPDKGVDYLHEYSVRLGDGSSGYRPADGRPTSFTSLAALTAQIRDGVVVESLQLSVEAVRPADWQQLRNCRALRLLAVYIPASASPNLDSLLLNIAALPKLEAVRLHALYEPARRPRPRPVQELPDTIAMAARLTVSPATALPFPAGAFSPLRELKLHGFKLPMEALIDQLGAGGNLQTVLLSANDYGVEQALPRNMAHLPRLTELSVNGHGWTGWGDAFTRLSGLRTLTLSSVRPWGPPLRSHGDNPAHRANEARLIADINGSLAYLTSLRQFTLFYMTGVEQLRLGTLSALTDLWIKGSGGSLESTLAGLPRLERLELTDYQLRQFPAIICSLRSLLELRLSRNELAALPVCIGQLQRLTTLFVADNPLKALPEMAGDLPPLRSLTLQNCQLQALPAFITRLSALHCLDLRQNELQSLPDSMGALRQLDTLQLVGNKLSRLPSSISQLINLTELSLDRNRLDSLPYDVGRLNQLRSLSIDQNQLRGLPERIGELASLQRFYIGINALTVLPASLGRLHQLRTLVIGRNNLTALPASLGRLTNLTELTIRDLPLTTLPAALSNLRQLDGLILQNTQLRALPTWISRLTQLKRLFVESDKLLTLPSQIGQLRRLESLTVAGHRFRYVPESIGKLKHLTFLRISGQIRGASSVTAGHFTRLPRALLACTTLSSLYISDQPSLDVSTTFNQLVRMPQLRHVSLERNGISALPAIDWRGIYWRSFSVAGNKLSRLPNELVDAPDMQMLDCNGNQLPALQNHSFHNHTLIREGVLAGSTR